DPFALELLTPGLTATVGKAVTLKGRLRRQPVFKEPVGITLTGLPKGVTLAAAPKPVAGNQSEFQIELRVDPKAGPVRANLTLACSTTIGGGTYAHPAMTVPLTVVAAK